MQAYARSLPDAPELADITAIDSNGRADMDVDGGGAPGRGQKRKRLYEDHRPMSSVAAGIKQGALHQVRLPQDGAALAVAVLRMQMAPVLGLMFYGVALGDHTTAMGMWTLITCHRDDPRHSSHVTHSSAAWLQSGLCLHHERSCPPQGSLRVNRFNPYEGYVGSESVGQDILLAGRAAMNRALDGDIVAVELLPEEQWSSASTQLRKHDDAEAPAEEVTERLWLALLHWLHTVTVTEGCRMHRGCTQAGQ